MIPQAEDPRNAAATQREAAASLSPQETAQMMAVLQANRDKNFVQRITNAQDWPVMQNSDGSYSSHRMGSAEGDGKGYAFPTLFYDKATNALYQPPNPAAEARRTGEFIEFPDPAQAERFANNSYKVGLNSGLLPQIRAAQQNPLEAAMQRLLGR